MDPKKAVEWVDENTIGVCAILGSTVKKYRPYTMYQSTNNAFL